MHEWAGGVVPDKIPRSASQPPAALNEAIAAALCFKRPERVYIAFDWRCLDERAEGERQDRTVGSGSAARYCDSGSSHARGKVSQISVFRDKERTRRLWAARLFCRAVPITHNVCVFASSEGEASRPCSGSHMLSFSRSDSLK